MRLSSRYGRRWPEVARHGVGRADLLQPVHPGSDVLGVEVIHAIREEMALSLDDLVLRRLDIGSAGSPGADVLRHCSMLAAAEWGWEPSRAEQAVRDLEHWYAKRTGSSPDPKGPRR